VKRQPVNPILWRAFLLNLPFVPAAYELKHGHTAQAQTAIDSLQPAFRARVRNLLGADDRSHVWKQAMPGHRRHFWFVIQELESRTLQTPELAQPVYYTHPFAHRPFVEYMLAVPPSVVCSPDQPRALMRAAFRGLLPEVVLRRRSKASFRTVFNQALRPLAAALLQTIDKTHLVVCGFVDPVSLESRLRRFLNGLECNSSQLSHLMIVEFWLRRRKARLQTEVGRAQVVSAGAASAQTAPF
jgi:hypothetical protein